LTGNVDIVTAGWIDIKCDGKKAAAIGALEDSCGSITVKGGSVNINMNTHTGIGIGCLSGSHSISLLDGEISIYGEGTELVGIGDHTTKSTIHILNGILSIQLYCASSHLTGNAPKMIIIDGGNIQCDFPEEQPPVNSYGSPLVSHIITDTDEFSQQVETAAYSYIYKANYSDRYPYIKVYLPENMILNTL
jgi:hypothetical protein